MAPLPRPVTPFGFGPRLPLKGSPLMLAALDRLWRARNGEWRRDHLGASVIGRECERQIWMFYRWVKAPDFDARMLRLFDRGHREEMVIVQELRGIGATVHDTDPDTGRQWTFVMHGGHFGGSADGIAVGIPDAPRQAHLLEIKTAATKPFENLVSKGVREVKPEHLAQMAVYMHVFRLQRALYVAVCKNDDRIYAERIEHDPDLAERMIDRAKRIIEAPAAPPKHPEKSPVCMWCEFAPICHQGAASTERNCRTCAFSTPATGGKWWCHRHGHELDRKAQIDGCADHDLHPDLGGTNGTP